MPKEKTEWEKEDEQSVSAVKPISEKQGKRLIAIAKSNGYTKDEVMAYLGAHHKIAAIKDIPWDKYEGICERFEVQKGA